MAARLKTKLYTFLNTNAVSLQTIMEASNDTYPSSVTLRAGKTNAGDVTWKDPAGTAGGYLSAGEAATFDLTGKFIPSRDLEFVGAQDDTLYISIIS